MLEPPSEHKCGSVEPALPAGDLLTVFKGNPLGMLHFIAADGLQDRGELSGANDSDEFEVDVEGTRVQVAGANDGVKTVDDHGLGVEHLVLAFVNSEAAANELIVNE